MQSYSRPIAPGFQQLKPYYVLTKTKADEKFIDRDDQICRIVKNLTRKPEKVWPNPNFSFFSTELLKNESRGIPKPQFQGGETQIRKNKKSRDFFNTYLRREKRKLSLIV